MVLVEGGETVVLRVSVCGVGERRTGRQVVDPEELGLVGNGVVAAEEEIDRVGIARAEGFGEFGAHKRGSFGGSETIGIAHAVQLDVGLHVFGELDCRKIESVLKGNLVEKKVSVPVSPASPL